MPNRQCRLHSTIALIFGLSLWLVPGVDVVNSQSPDDESLLRAATRKFLEASQQKDIDGALSLWSAKSPDLPAFAAAVKQTFAEVGSIELKSVDIKVISVDATKATVRAIVEMHATNLKSGKPAAGFGRGHRTFQFVKEDGQWKLWSYARSEELLAQSLLSAKTGAEQTALLDKEKDLVTPELTRVLRTQAETYLRQNDLGQAFPALRLTAVVAEKVGDEKALAFAVNLMAVVHFTRGEYPQALELFTRHLSFAVTASDRAETARTLHNIGTVKRLQADFTGALDYLLRSLEVAEQIGDKLILSGILNSIGVVHRELGNYARALAYFERSLATIEGTPDKATTGLTLNNIGTIYGSQGNHAQALEYFQRALRLGQSSNDKGMMAHALNNIGITYYSKRDYGRALEFYQQSLKLREELNDKRMAALTLNNIGIIHREQGDHSRALQYYKDSLALREKLGDQAGIATVWNQIGIIHYLQGDFAQSLEISGKVLDTATRLANPELLWRGYELAGRAHAALKQFDEAEKALSNSIQTIETLRHRVGGGELARQRFFEDKLPPYLAMVDLSFSRGRPADALTYAELAKARTLLDVLRNGRVLITKTMTAEEQETERASNAELHALNTQLHEEAQRPQPNRNRIAELEPRREKARLAHEAFLTRLYVKHPELKIHRGETTPITTDEMASLLPDAGSAFLEFVVAEEKSYLIVVTKDRRATAPRLTLYSLKVTAKQLSERVNDFRRMLADRDLSYQSAAREIYDVLLKPAEQQLRGKRTLCIVPDKSLWELPFQALQPRSGVHLVEDFTLFYAPSLTVLREIMKKRVNPTTSASVVQVAHRRSGASSRALKTLFALGNPQSAADASTVRTAETEAPLGTLPEAEKEVKTLARLYGTGNSRVFVGSQAREGVVKLEAPKHAILHFATHGLLDDRNPMFSYLALAQVAGDTHEDGLLEAREIINLDLRAELAVLSACEMARGWVGAGEGVIGMSWALFVAGVPTTVASQWKVDSASTTNLMIDFHRRLTMRDPRVREPKAESLRQAALGLLRSDRYKHPFYWAGFVMVGDGWVTQ